MPHSGTLLAPDGWARASWRLWTRLRESGRRRRTLPSTWRYVGGYVHGQTLRHTGYVFAHRLYVNSVDASPWGVPPWFYAAFFVMKVPLIVLAFAAAGILWVWRHPAHRGATFVRVLLVLLLVRLPLSVSLPASDWIVQKLPPLLSPILPKVSSTLPPADRTKRLKDPAFPIANVVPTAQTELEPVTMT